MPSVRSPKSIMEYEELDSFLRFYLVAFKNVDIALIEKTSLEIEEKFLVEAKRWLALGKRSTISSRSLPMQMKMQ